VKEEDIPKPDFTPKTNFGKTSAAKRNSSPGSQYGKKTASVKLKAAAKPTFQPVLNVGSVGQKLRAKTKSRILDASMKAAEKGKLARAEHELAQQQKKTGFEVGRYTLAADKSAPQATVEVGSGMVFSHTPLHTTETTPIEHTKASKKQLESAKSHYTPTVYKPPVGAKPEKAKEEYRWEIGKTAAVVEEPANRESPTAKKNATVKSHYSADAYKPKQGEKPEKKLKSEVDWVVPIQSPHVSAATVIGKSLEELDVELKEVRKPSAKFSKVESSGYGVKSPVPNIEAKVGSYKRRSIASMLRSSDFKSSQSPTATSVEYGTENVRPPSLGAEGATLINDLLGRAAMMDGKPMDGKPAGGSATVVEVDEPVELELPLTVAPSEVAAAAVAEETTML
jgi:hypothetical protein